jgi:hypothetical protein
MTPAIITATPGVGRGSPSRIAASVARHRRRAKAAVTTPAMISRTPNRLPRPMERLPRQEPCGCDAGGDEYERRPKPRKIPFTVPARPDEIAIKRGTVLIAERNGPGAGNRPPGPVRCRC